jgi:preprotein translocase subunit SecG
MLAAAIGAVFIVFALFLSMLSSSPKDDAEWNIDTEA